MSRAADPHRIIALSGTAFAVVGLSLSAAAVIAPDLLGALYRVAATSATSVEMSDATRFGAGLFGALTLGWGIMLALLGRQRPLAQAAWQGALAWFVVDSTASVLLGFGWNVLGNVFFLLPFLLLNRREA